MTIDTERLTAAIAAAAAAGKISASAADNIRRWLAEPEYQDFTGELARHIRDERWDVLNDVFWTVIPFGTAGRRGRMYPIGCNAINEATIGQSAQGLADYVRGQHPADTELRCAIAYDTRHRSREFAELCGEIMVAAGFRVYAFSAPRSTPLLSFTVRQVGAQCGIMISASHNPPTDNAIKVFWSCGSQLRPPHDAGVMRCVSEVRQIRRRPLSDARSEGLVVDATAEMDQRFQAAVLARSIPGPRKLRILYSPLHGVGLTSVVPVLSGDGFAELEVYAPQAAPDGNFPNVQDQIPNPERPEIFAPLIARARQMGADLVLASDPDADRIGCAAPLVRGGGWQTLTGNQIGALLTDFVLRNRRQSSHRAARPYIVKTLVTSEMLGRVAGLYGVRTVGNVLTGFKWIAGVVEELGVEGFQFGAEEAHGYTLGHVRDKDAAVAAMLLAEVAAEARLRGQTLHDALDALYRQVGYHAELTVSHTFSGQSGASQMRVVMSQLRTSPPATLAGLAVTRVDDYLADAAASLFPFAFPPPSPERDLIVLRLASEGNYVAVRPSGTEPKIKFYFFAYRPPAQGACDSLRHEVQQQLMQMRQDLFDVLDEPASAGSSRAS
jgi:phosphoglucomutase/phosphomannomutase